MRDPTQQTALHIVHLEDNALDAELTSALLKGAGFRCDIVVVEKESDFRRALTDPHLDLILSDLSMPSYDGSKALQLAREICPEVPFIFLSGTMGEDAAIESLVSGATDYVMKTRISRLAPAVMRALRESKEKRERTLAEKKAREAQELFRLIAENAEDLIAVLDLEGRRVYSSPSYGRLLGNPALLRGSDSFNDIHADDRDRIREIFRLTVETGVGRRAEYRLVGKEGKIHIIESQGNVIRDPSGAPVQVVVVSRDVTERKEAEGVMRKLSAALEASGDPMVITDRSGVIEFVNPAFEQCTGYNRAEAVGNTPRILKSGFHDQEFYRKMWEGILSGEICHTTFLNRRKNGEIYYQEETITPIVDSAGIITHFVSSGRDVTERQRAEIALEESEGRYRSLVENARDAIFSIMPDGTLSSMNAAFEHLTGWKREEWIGKPFPDILHPDDRAKAFERFRELIHGTAPALVEYRIRKRNGEYMLGEVTATAQWKDGTIIGILGIARDITERRNLQAQLFQAQKMESIGTLASGIAHDFNNILAIILGHVSLLQIKKNDPGTMRTSIDAINTSVQRGADLVRQILTFARRTDESLEPVSVNAIIQEMAAMLRETFPKTVEVVLDLKKAIPVISMDHTQFHQAVLNLCVNARDAMLEGTPDGPRVGTLRIATRVADGQAVRNQFPDATAEQYVSVAVSDTGVGMDAATAQRIFEPFFTTKDRGKGTGLGLAVVYGAVKSHGGIVDVESTPGKGSTFTLYFPVPRDVAQSAEKPKGDSIIVRGGSETVMVVEDEDALLGLMSVMLEEKGYRVVQAHDGVEALELYGRLKDEVAAVLTDIGLPKLDGRELLRQLHALNPAIRVIVATGFLDPETKTYLAGEGAKAIIMKPYKPAEVLRVVRDVLDSPDTVE